MATKEQLERVITIQTNGLKTVHSMIIEGLENSPKRELLLDYLHYIKQEVANAKRDES